MYKIINYGLAIFVLHLFSTFVSLFAKYGIDEILIAGS